MYINKSELTNMLEQVGIKVKDNKVSGDDLNLILSSMEPEWLLLDDYKIEGADNYRCFIENEECKLNRIVLPASYSIANLGKFVGLVYQYSLTGNPRNIHYAYRLFLGNRPASKNSGFTSLYTAKLECSNEANKLLGTKLDTNQ